MPSFKAQPFFEYQRLERTTNLFRLCKLLPADAGAPIECELIHEEISLQKEKYFALSYTWGELSEQRWIRLNGKPFHVQPNLMQALKAIRKCDEPLVLWIDRICIDQSETLEKNHQVSMMGSIYKNASAVLAWLGPAADESDLVFDYFDNQGLKTEPIINNPESQQPSTTWNLDNSLSNRQNSLEDKSLQQAFATLIRRPYWRRAWIKQELILAKDITIYCGSRSRDWNLFTIWATLLRLSTLDEDPENFVPDLFMHRSKVRKGELSTLVELLERYRNTEATDVRDRVFALLSLASDCQGKEKVLVDYNSSRPALYFAFLAYFKPTNITRMAAALQEVLRVRRIQLMEFWQSVTLDSYKKTNSLMESLAFDYVLKVRAYSESATAESDLECFLGHLERVDIELPSKTAGFIARSYFAMTNGGATKLHNSRLFPIAETRFNIRVQPTLFGSRFLGIYQTDSEDKESESGSCTLYKPQFNIEDIWRYMVLPFIVLGTKGEFIYSKDLVDSVKDSVAKSHGAEALKPSIDVICYTLYKASLDETETHFHGKWCLVDCMYILTTLYGYKILKPREGWFDGSDGDTFGPLPS